MERRTNMHRRRFLQAFGRIGGGLSVMMLLPDILRGGHGEKGRMIRWRRFVMGTTMTVVAPASEFSSGRIRPVFEVLDDIDRLLSLYKPASDLSRVNRSPGRWQNVSPYCIQVAAAARRFGVMTRGAFDVTILPLMRHWGFYPREEPSRTLHALVEHVDFHKLEVRRGQVRMAEAGYAVDFGGIGKGYGVDRAIEALRRQGEANALIAVSGDMYALGRPAPHRRWTIGIQSPYRKDAIAGTVELENEAISTSGGYENVRVYRDMRIAHILNPRHGVSADRMLSATIVAPDDMTADALSTATYVMGIEEAQRLVAGLPGVEGIWIDRYGRIVTTPGIRKRLRIM